LCVVSVWCLVFVFFICVCALCACFISVISLVCDFCVLFVSVYMVCLWQFLCVLYLWNLSVLFVCLCVV